MMTYYTVHCFYLFFPFLLLLFLSSLLAGVFKYEYNYNNVKRWTVQRRGDTIGANTLQDVFALDTLIVPINIDKVRSIYMSSDDYVSSTPPPLPPSGAR